MIAIIAFGPRSTLGFFLTPLSTANHWGRDVFAFALALQNLLWGIGQPLADAATAEIDRRFADQTGAGQQLLDTEGVPLAEIVVLSDFWSPIGEIRSMLAGLSASGAHGTLVQIVDPAEESFPYSGRIEFVEPEGGGVITAGRAEKWAGDYVARLAQHRDEIRSETNMLDWLFSTHTTSRSAAELLLFLHSGMMVAKGSARTATVKAGRSA